MIKSESCKMYQSIFLESCPKKTSLAEKVLYQSFFRRKPDPIFAKFLAPNQSEWIVSGSNFWWRITITASMGKSSHSSAHSLKPEIWAEILTWSGLARWYRAVNLLMLKILQRSSWLDCQHIYMWVWHAESVISGSEKLNPSVGGRSQSQEKILGSQGVLKGSESRKRGQHREAR